MAEFNLNDLLDAAKEAGFETKTLPAGRYADAEVTHVNVTGTQGGGSKAGIRFKIHGGPENGNGIWMNQTLPNKAKQTPEKFAQSSAIFLRIMASLGVELSNNLLGSLEAIKGQHFDIDVSYKESGIYTNTNVAIKGKVASSVPAASSPKAPVVVDDSDYDDDDKPV